MSQLISEHQTAFVQGRFIAENFLTTREVLRHIHRSASPAVLLKLDFAKAYDTLDWAFLNRVLQTRGFPEKILKWISHMLATATSRILINGQLSNPFKHKRGLRQGDPLSPYLFIIAADVLQRMTTNISLAIPHGLSEKIPSPIVNFQYADDTILIASAKGDTLRLLVMVIHCFTLASGLKVNLDKSTFVPIAIQQHLLGPIERLLQCKQGSLPITYLGMPLSIKKPTRSDYLPLLEKIERRLQGWKAKLISRAGKLQLVKSVLSSIPTYFMSCFKFPKWLLARIDTIRRQFLWARNEDTQAIHLVNWPTVCLPIQCGGMGVINLHLQNIALLLRWLWRLYEGDDKLWATYAAMIYAIRPAPDGPLILARSGSFFWTSLLKLRPIFSSAARFQPLSGKRISFWFDSWSGQPLAPSTHVNLPHRTISLFEAKQRVDQLFPRPLTHHHDRAVQTLASFTPAQGVDNLLWMLSASGRFSVKSIYKILSQGGKTRSETKAIWKASVTPSMRMFFFLLLKNRLLTHDIMLKRKLLYEPGCVMCDRTQPEEAGHLFFTCRYANQIWMLLASQLGGNVIFTDSTSNTYLKFVPRGKDRCREWTTMFITVLWFLWRERNERTFRGNKLPAFVLATRILQEAKLCLNYC